MVKCFRSARLVRLKSCNTIVWVLGGLSSEVVVAHLRKLPCIGHFRPFENKDRCRSNIVCFWGNFFVNENINGDLITIIHIIKGIACHTNTYMQLYTLHIGWLYLGNWLFGQSSEFVDVSISKCDQIKILGRTDWIFLIRESFARTVESGDPSSNACWSFLYSSGSHS